MKKLYAIVILLAFSGTAFAAPDCDHPTFHVNGCSYDGAQGEQGEQGIQGIQGEQGERGPRGYTGATGATGEQGIQGVKGDKGDKGDTGAAGIDGTNGIDGVAGLDGADGIDGQDGIDGAAGKDGTDVSQATIDSYNKRLDKYEDDLDDARSESLAFDSIQIHLPQKKKHRLTLSITGADNDTGQGIGYAYMFSNEGKNRIAIIGGIGNSADQTVGKAGITWEF